MDATVEEVLVQGGDSVAPTRWSSRPTKPTAKLQEKMQATAKKIEAAKNNGSDQPGEGENAGGNEFTDKAVESRMAGGATSNNASLMQIMLRAMLQETSAHLMSEQKKMLERLWDALMENQNKATKVMRDQLEKFGRLEQEIRSIRTEAAEDRKKTEQLRGMHEQTADELRAVRGECQLDRLDRCENRCASSFGQCETRRPNSVPGHLS
ncbi:hypothetical protein EDB80DRAFT_223978 [Ilyonectria destructans]|nr:hypothetical protein EDB80DRAFT_223978 [Ilyonectria destructans]